MSNINLNYLNIVTNFILCKCAKQFLAKKHDSQNDSFDEKLLTDVINSKNAINAIFLLR